MEGEATDHDKEWVLNHVRHNWLCLERMPIRFRQDRDVIRAAVAVCGEALRYAWIPDSNQPHLWVRTSICDDKNIAMLGAKNNGYILAYLSDRLKDDADVVSRAITSYPNIQSLASDRLQRQYEML